MRIRSLRSSTGRGDSLAAKAEYSLVDGAVANTNPSENEVFISIGRRQNVILGMNFAVYGDETQIRPDAEGNYPQGQVEVVNVGETSSRCRVLFERAGNPIVPGDVIANAVYDPNKVYKFLVAGNFDTNGDGNRTPASAPRSRRSSSGAARRPRTDGRRRLPRSGRAARSAPPASTPRSRSLRSTSARRTNKRYNEAVRVGPADLDPGAEREPSLHADRRIRSRTR